MHASAFSFVANAAQQHSAHSPVYEIGSRNINGSVRALFDRSAGNYLGIDIVSGPDVDLVADAATYAPPMTPQTVVCCEVLEHTPDARTIFAKACEVLAPGGLLIITCAGEGRAPHSAYDGGPLKQGEYYQNIDTNTLASWAIANDVEPLKTFHPEVAGDSYFAGRKRVHP